MRSGDEAGRDQACECGAVKCASAALHVRPLSLRSDSALRCDLDFRRSPDGQGNAASVPPGTDALVERATSDCAPEPGKRADFCRVEKKRSRDLARAGEMPRA